MGLSHKSRKVFLLAIGVIWLIALCVPVLADSAGDTGLTINFEASKVIRNCDSHVLGPRLIDNLQHPECRDVREVAADQQCAFAKRYCKDQDDGILSYVDFYYCRISTAQPVGLIVLLLWMIFLFSSLGVVAGDFLAVNLNSIAQNLQISDTLAGVTFLALGNGAPDIFSTIAAMGENSNNLAFGELIGAAAFITGVVSGSMALVRPFDVVKVPLVRDAIFLIATIVFLLYILSDGYLRLWHCVTLLLIYLVYIVVVVSWHWWHARRRGLNATDGGSTYGPDGGDYGPAEESEALLSQEEAQDRGQEARTTHQHQHRQNYATISQNNESISTSTPKSRDPNEDRNFLKRVLHVLIPTYTKRGRFGLLHLLAYVVMLPTTIALKITTPRIEDEEQEASNDGSKAHETNDQDNDTNLNDAHWDRWLTVIHCFTAPQLIMWLIARQLDKTASQMFLPSMICLGSSAVIAGLLLFATPSDRRPTWWRFLSLPGFIVSIAWISALADEIVAVLKILGIICDIPDAIMGITAFAIGNSVDDWAANVSVARRKRPVMALSACFGGPLLNILLGISISGIIAFVGGANSKHEISAITLHPNRSLFFVSGSAILNICVLLVLMLWTRWRMERVVGYILASLWIICTVVNVVLELRR